MVIDIEGKMLVGERVSKLNISEEMLEQYDCEDEYEFYTEILDYASPYFDSDPEDWFVGYGISNTSIGDDGWTVWVNRVEEAAKNFQRLTGVPARLIGTQNVF